MRANIGLWTLALGALVLSVPSAVSPVEDASAYCMLQIDGIDDCFNPCMEAGGVYGAARQATGTEDKTPDMYCPA
jgi:hypothetical protein